MPKTGYKQTKAHRKKISDFCKTLTGSKNPFYGKHHTKETKRRLKEFNMGRIHSSKTKRKMREANKKQNEINPNYGMRGKHHTKKTIKKYTIKRKTWCTPIKDTKIEVKIQNFLKQLGIEFFTHQYMKIKHGYQCDILIPYLNLVVECDGNYWHKYPVGKDIDHIRTRELIRKGFKVLRLWEFEINDMSINTFKKRLKNVR